MFSAIAHTFDGSRAYTSTFNSYPKLLAFVVYSVCADRAVSHVDVIDERSGQVVRTVENI